MGLTAMANLLDGVASIANQTVKTPQDGTKVEIGPSAQIGAKVYISTRPFLHFARPKVQRTKSEKSPK
jgi:hypothetical protein